MLRLSHCRETICTRCVRIISRQLQKTTKITNENKNKTTVIINLLILLIRCRIIYIRMTIDGLNTTIDGNNLKRRKTHSTTDGEV